MTALISGVEWMCIKIWSFVLKFPDPNPRRMMFKKWKELPFGIPEATIDEILQHSKDEVQDDIDFGFTL